MSGHSPLSIQDMNPPAVLIVPPSVIGSLAAGDINGLGRLTVLRDGFCFDPPYLRWQVEMSRQRLALETVDCLFLHNLDAFRSARGREECRQTLGAECQPVRAIQG